MDPSPLLVHFQTLARYNRVVNERLYQACAQLDGPQYRQERPGSFRSIHRTLNHILLSDRIWMGRFTSQDVLHTPSLHTLLYDDWGELQAARAAEDARMETFFTDPPPGFLEREIRYVNSQGIEFTDPVPLLVAHMFNHQTHHRAQIHVMLSDSPVKPPSLDMHRALRPVPVPA